MPLTTYTKNYANSSGLNNGAMWVGGVVPVASTDSQALYNDSASTTGSCVIGASTTWGQILVTNTIGSLAISFSSSQTLTLTPTSYSNIGIDMAAAFQNFTIAALTALGSSQTWTVASGRTLTISGAISGTAKNLTLVGAGIKTFSGASTGWTGSTVTVSAGQTNANTINALGAASNIVVVDSGANLTTSVAIVQTDIRVSGTGFTGGTGYGSFYTTNVLAATNVITAEVTGTVLSFGVNSGSSVAATIATSVGVTSITLNTNGTTDNIQFSAASSYSVSDGVRLQSKTTAGAAATARYSFGTANGITDANTQAGGGLGATTNKVIVEETGCISYVPTVSGNTLTLARNYDFTGITAPSSTQYKAAVTASGLMDFTGTVFMTGSAGQSVFFAGSNVYGNLTGFKFSYILMGATNLWVGEKGSSSLASSVSIGANLDSSGFTGTLYTNAINYYGGGTANPTFPLVLRGPSASTTYINAIGAATASHNSYARETGTEVNFNPSSVGQTGNLTLGGGAWSSSPGTWQIDAGTLTLNFSFNGTTGVLNKLGASTLVLGGNNSSITNVTLNAGTLVLNSAGSAGPSVATFTFATNTTTIDSTAGATLNQNGLINTGAAGGSWTWVGTNDLAFGTGNVTQGGDRTITHGATGGVGTLKFRGNITTITSTLSWNFGGSTAGAKQRVTLVGANDSQVAATAADQHSVTAGYFRIENNNGLGAAGTTTTWWVGATNLGVQTTNAALELAAVTTPDTKNVNLYNTGPNNDGALIGVSGTSIFRGAISVSNVAGTRIGVKSGATLTLPGSGIYPNLNPANANTPLAFTAESAGTLNQDRALGANVGTVTVTGGSGTVVFSRANTHTGAMTCSAGTTKVTNVNATSTGNVVVSAGATLESAVQSNFQSILSLGTLSSVSRAILKFAA